MTGFIGFIVFYAIVIVCDYILIGEAQTAPDAPESRSRDDMKDGTEKDAPQ